MNTILLIEDNADLLENTGRLLQLANYHVIKARNGKEGLELARVNRPDLILCDIVMPELDGYGVLRALGNIPELKGTPFVFVTAKADKSDFRYGMDLGADDYLTKPFSGEELLSIISARLKKTELIRGAFMQASLDATGPVHEGKKLQDINQLLARFPLKKLNKKQSLFIEGETSKYLFYLSSGKIKTFKTNNLGKEYITNIYTPGQFFAFGSLLEDAVHEESAEAIEDAEIIFIPQLDFINILEENPLTANTFITSLVLNLSEIKENLIGIAYSSARKRVAEALLFISQKYGDADDMVFPMNRNDISAISGITPESVSRNLTDFRKEGLIKVENGCLRILDFQKLKNVRN